jgi:hypothetical protein
VAPRNFLTGVNLPWMHYGGDFGANAWRPLGGIAQPDRRAELDETLARLSDSGFTLLRWFLLGDARAGVIVDDRGEPAGIDAALERDLDTALACLERHGLRALFVVVDFLIAHPAQSVRGVQTRGRVAWLRRPDTRARFVEHVIAPLGARAGAAPALFGWDLINEPEWVTLGWGGWDPRCCITRRTLRAFVGEASAVLRSSSAAPITVGLASARGLPLVRDLGLDFYQVHWYDHVDPPSTLVTQAATYALDAPLWLGEFPTLQSSQAPVDILSAVEHAGYAGAFAWSHGSQDAFSSASVCEREVARYGVPAVEARRADAV